MYSLNKYATAKDHKHTLSLLNENGKNRNGRRQNRDKKKRFIRKFLFTSCVLNSDFEHETTDLFTFSAFTHVFPLKPLVSTDTTDGEHPLVYKSVTLERCFTCCCCFWCLNIAHVSAADVFAVCGWVFRAAPNDPTHMSSEETAVTERVPAETLPISSQL